MTETLRNSGNALSDQLATFLTETRFDTQIPRRWLRDNSSGASVYVRRTRRCLGDPTDVKGGFLFINEEFIRPGVTTLDIVDIEREDPQDVRPVANIMSTIYRVSPQHGVRALYADNLGDPQALAWMDSNGWEKTEFFLGRSRDNRYILLPKPSSNVVLGVFA